MATSRIRQVLRSTSTPLDEIRPHLWNDSVTSEAYDRDKKAYQAAVMDQYKVYVEMADRVSARRSLANTFFLTLNTAVFVAVGVFWNHQPVASRWLLIFPTVALLIQCASWFFIVRSYRQLNTGKYAVVGLLEERLPASPYLKAEWKALGEGSDNAKYWPLTHLEQWIPVAFAATYVAGASVALWS